jgi:hypothetical protein
MPNTLTGNPAAVDLDQSVVIDIPDAGQLRAYTPTIVTPQQQVANYIAALKALIQGNSRRWYCRVARPGVQVFAGGGSSGVPVLFTLEADDSLTFGLGDPDGMHTPANGTFEIKPGGDGVYSISAEADLGNNGSGQAFDADFLLGVTRAGNEKLFVGRDFKHVALSNGAFAFDSFSISSQLALIAGDVLRLYVLNGSAGAIELRNAHFSMARVSI